MDTRSEAKTTGTNFPGGRTVPSLRWWIGAPLFASTFINYIDRRTFSLLAPYLRQDYHWTNKDYANLGIAFRVAYAIGQTLNGRLMDGIGTKRGLTLTVLWYSIVSVLTPLARVFCSFLGFRFFLVLGESGNWPGATKAVSEWFPTILTVNLYVLTLLFALATFSFASFTTIANVLPSDLYKNESVATVSGFNGTGPPSARLSFSNWRAIFPMRVLQLDALVRPAHSYHGPDSLLGYGSRAPAGAQYQGDGRRPRSPNLKFCGQVVASPVENGESEAGKINSNLRRIGENHGCQGADFVSRPEFRNPKGLYRPGYLRPWRCDA